MVNKKSGQGGSIGITRKVTASEDQTCLLIRMSYSGLVRWDIRNVIGICLGLVTELFGNGGATAAFGEEVISATAVRILFPMSACRTGLHALSSKGMASSFIPSLRNHPSSTVRSMFAMSVAGKASWILGMLVPGVYLSSGDLVGAWWVSWASPRAAAAAALSRRVRVLGVWLSAPLWVVMAMPWLAWVARSRRASWMSCAFSFWTGVF